MAAERSLNRFLWLRSWITRVRAAFLRSFGGLELASEVNISLSARLIPTVSGAIRIGDHTTIGPLALLWAGLPDGSIAPITIGERCFIGSNAVIGPGVTIGDGVVVGAGSVVLHSIPADCMIAGNPALIIRNEIGAGRFGRLPKVAETDYQRELEEVMRSLLRKVGR